MSESVPSNSATSPPAGLLRLHIGGWVARPGWKVLDVNPGPHVDYVGNCRDLSQFGDGSVGEVYASHVYEHLAYQKELPAALAEVHRVLCPGGVFRVSVPDLETLCRLFLDPKRTPQERFHVMRMMFGGQMDGHDFHYVGLTAEFLAHFLAQAGFRQMKRVQQFGLFEDTSNLRVGGVLISLNVEAVK